MTTHDHAAALDTVYAGSPWYGDSITDIFTAITPEMVGIRLTDGGHSIIELVHHMAAWREFAVEMLMGNTDFRIEINSLDDWRIIAHPAPDDWADACKRLDDSQQKLLEALRGFPDKRLTEAVPERPFSFDFLLLGVVQHDVYHLGQITLLRRAASSNER